MRRKIWAAIIFISVISILPTKGFAEDALFVDADGNVGIGNSNPNRKLKVFANDDLDGASFYSANSWIQIYPGTLWAGAYNPITQDGDTGIIFGGESRDTGNFVLAPWSSSKGGLRITSNGYIGIGTRSPLYNLHIARNADASSTLGGAPAVLMLEQANNNNWSDGEAAAEILFKKGDDIVGAIRSEHTRSGGTHSYEDAGLAFYVAPASETPTAFEAMRINHEGYIGIGTTTPVGKLHVTGANGTPAIYLTGEDNIWFDDGQVRITTHDGYGGWQIKQGADNDDKYCGVGDGAVKLLMTEDGTLQVRTSSNGTIGNSISWNLGLYQNSAGNVGIGRWPTYKLDVLGTLRVNTTLYTSDERLKKNIKKIDKALDQITNIRGVSYEWKDTFLGERKHLGVLASEIEEIYPELVYTDDEGIKSVDYVSMIAPMIEAMKELKAENDHLTEQNSILEERMSEIEAVLGKLASKNSAK